MELVKRSNYVFVLNNFIEAFEEIVVLFVLHQVLDHVLVDTDVPHAHHYHFPMVLYSKVTSGPEFVIEAHESVSADHEIARMLKEMEAN